MSVYLDDELTAADRLRLDLHVRSCERCRDHLRSLQGTIGLVRQLDALAAPRVLLPRPVPAERAARWERIRSRRLAPPRPMLRPMAYAAAALVMVLALAAALDRLGRAPVETDAARPELQARIPSDSPGLAPEERPDWLKREIARRVLEARSQAGEEEAPATSPEEPLQVAALEPAAPPPVDEGTPLDRERPLPETGATPPPAPRNQVTSRTPETTPEPPEETPQAEVRIADAARTAPGGARSAGEAATPMALLLPVPAATPQETPSSPPAAAPTAPQPSPVIRSVAPPRDAPAPPAEPLPQEIGAVYHTVAMFDPAAGEGDVAFLDPEALATAQETLGRESTLESVQGKQPVEERPEPEPDAETGILPAVPLERPGADLGGRAAEVRDRGFLTPIALRTTISATGSVTAVTVVTGSGLPWLDEAIVEAVRRWSFQPAERYGEPLATVQEIVVEFDLD